MIIVVKAGKWIAKHRFIILLLGILLLIPSFIGMAKTRINYDLLSYLPESLETVEGQDVMVDEYGMGAFAMVVVEDTDMKDIQKLADQFNKVDHVEKVLWYGDVADLSLPVEMIPSDLRKAFYNGDATLMLALFDNTTSSDEAMNAVGEMRKIASKQCFIAGMTGVVADIKNVAMKEVPIYVVIAAILSFLVLEITGESFLVPIFFLISIGVAIVYFIAYILILIVSVLLISINNFDFTTSFTGVLTTLNNVGPGLNLVGPVENFAKFSDFSKIVFCVDMLIGRLEIFPFLMLFSPSLWSRKF